MYISLTCFAGQQKLTNVVKQLCCCCCSVAQLYLPLCDSSILHYLLEFAQIYALKQLYSNKKKWKPLLESWFLEVVPWREHQHLPLWYVASSPLRCRPGHLQGPECLPLCSPLKFWHSNDWSPSPGLHLPHTQEWQAHSRCSVTVGSMNKFPIPQIKENCHSTAILGSLGFLG